MKKIFTIMLAAVMAVSMLAACGGAEEAPVQETAAAGTIAAETAGQEASAAETITITDARGEVEIPADPQRIVDLSGNSDILSVLGYSVVGTANSDAYDYTKFPAYLEETLAGAKILGYSMQDTMDIEGILELNPDLIIISTVQEKMYEQLKEIAPTVMIELAQINWRDDVATLAALFGKEAEADAWMKAYDEKAAAKGLEIKEALGEETTYLSFLASGGQLFIFDAAAMGSIMYEDMGLAKPANMPEQTNISLPVVTYEGLAEIDPDYMIVLATDADMEALEASPIYNNMRAVKEGNVVELPSSPYFNQGYSCIGKNVFVDELAALLAE